MFTLTITRNERYFSLLNIDPCLARNIDLQVAFQSNANHPLAESMGYIKFEEM